jgi:hypothetical protein
VVISNRLLVVAVEGAAETAPTGGTGIAIATGTISGIHVFFKQDFNGNFMFCFVL